MKKLIFILTLFYTLTSCVVKQEDLDRANTGAVIQFSTLSGPQSNARVSAIEGITPMEIPVCNADGITSIFLTIEKEDSSVIFSGELPVTYFPGIGAWQAVMDNIVPGDYFIADLIVLDDNDNALFALPHEGTQYGAFVSKPALIPFTIVNGEKSKVTADVVCVEPGDLPLFGVEIYQFDLISLFKFGMFANYCDENGHHKANLLVWTEYNGNAVLAGEENGIDVVLIPDQWNVPDSLEEVTVTAYIVDTDTWLQATKTVEEWRDFENMIYHLYYDCASPLWCDTIDEPDNAQELLDLVD